MSLSRWLASFRDLHERARRGSLPEAERAVYRAAREELARALVVAQRLTLKPGETARQSLRVARALQVELELPAGRERTVTIDVSQGGFSCLVAAGVAPGPGDRAAFSLRLPAAAPLTGRARVAHVRPVEGRSRVAFQFLALDPDARERLETFVFDTVLAQLA